MVDKDKYLKRINKIEDKLLLSKILDKLNKMQSTWGITYSNFLDPYQRRLVADMFTQYQDIEYSFNGGYNDAERQIVIFIPTFSSEILEIKSIIRGFKISTNSSEKLSHRDFLGSLVGLGIKREKIGDILVKDDGCEILVLDEIADFILYNFEKVKHSKVIIQEIDINNVKALQNEVKVINSTVASLRLDSIASLGFGISRSKIVEYIKGSKVYVNWQIVESCSKQINVGDIITIRGKGRIVFDSINGKTKKDRIGIILMKMI